MKRNVRTKVKLNYGNVCVLTDDTCDHVVFMKDVRPENHKIIWLALEYDWGRETATLGECFHKPNNGHWGAFETLTGFVLAKWATGVWWFYAGEYEQGTDLKLVSNWSTAFCFETKRQTLVALAILNLKELKNEQ